MLNPLEMLAAEAYDEGSTTEVIRPAAVLPESNAKQVLVELAMRDARSGGLWWSEPTQWLRYDRSWDGEAATQGTARHIGTLQVAYGTPTRYEITVYRVTVTAAGSGLGWTVETLCDEAFGFGGLTLASCPRADLAPPPPPFRLR